MILTISDIKELVNLYGAQCTLVGEKPSQLNAKRALEYKHKLESAIEALDEQANLSQIGYFAEECDDHREAR